MEKTGCPSEQYVLSHLDKSLEKHDFLLYFQPAVRSFSKKVCGMEVLSRWETQEYGVLAPGAYIGVLEKHQLIYKLDCYMIENLCSCMRLWLNEGRPVVPVSFNLSRLDFELCDIFSIVENAVMRNQIPRELLHVEVTESTLADHTGIMKICLKKFNSAGYQIWMDDFGSGYSSLNVLKDYDFDLLKIDMWFFSDFSVRAKKIIRSVINMTKEIGMKTQAEGVETEEQYQFLKDIGCENVQGYLFSKPMPYFELIVSLQEKGIIIEEHRERDYYDQIGRVNILSPSPFLLNSDVNESLVRSSIPLGIIEVFGESMHMLYANGELTKEFKNLRISADDAGLNSLRLNTSSSKHLLWEMIQKTETDKEKNFSIVERGNYFTIQTKLIASCGNRFAVLITIHNMLRNIDIYRHSQMDAKLRYLYAVYSSVMLIDLEHKSYEVLSTSGYRAEGQKAIKDKEASIDEFISEYIYLEDQRLMRRLLIDGEIRDELDSNSLGSVVWYVRVMDSPGNYSWQYFVAIYVAEWQILLCLRHANQEWASLIAKHEQAKNQRRVTEKISGVLSDTVITKEKLWDTFSAESGYGLFWKDKDRRFIGVNQKFLDYYGIEDPRFVIGKNDEDMGWHIDPNPFKNDEKDVLQKGITILRIPGNCLVKGVNHSIQATKMPIYDDGRIIGLFGFFWDIDNVADASSKRGDFRSGNRYLDPLTGLLNADGLHDSVRRYVDSYQLYGQNFAWYCMTIDNYEEMSSMHGRDFSLRVLGVIATVLRSHFGTSCSIARYIGDTFILVNGFSSQKSSDELINILETTVGDIHLVGDVSCTLFPSVGSASYSECNGLGAMEKLAAKRMMERRKYHRRNWS